MTSSFDYTPPGLADGVPGAVKRRHIYYVPGYDPEGSSRYRMLFVRELTRYAKRFSEPKRSISRATMNADETVQSWRVAAQPETQGAETTYDVLLWDDIVRTDFRRLRLVSVALLVLGTLQTIATGLMVRFYRLNWKYGNVILYPLVMVVLLALCTLGIAAFVHAHLGTAFGHSLGWPLWITLPAGLVIGLAWVKAMEALLNRIFFWQLLNDWVFNWQHGQGRRPDYERRLDVFADHILARQAAFAASGDIPDEIVILGHSSGALTAVEVVARLLARDPNLGDTAVGDPAPGRGATTFALVTLGSGLPLVALQPRAARLRGEIAALVASRRLVWVDFQAPQDWMNFPGFNPVAHLALDLRGQPPANPLVRSARFREIISAETYTKVRWRPFRMHFQFLLANDQRGYYDFFAMTLGPQRLRERVLNPVQPGSTAS
ncbi:alpha/beta hydrolase [Methylobacterium sp. J-068]|uniref:alpha/beta hydrolase n=1 Tax=Methylobacterium sp. J-068 TaxID=2836649 RepID=UPI001FBBCE2A|nr:alpha/beta hydrolase [Methylobacterium sp. J-068]MCJ2033302.1 alpha/beta hydrolase [Methylobacterium sp. J-068]